MTRHHRCVDDAILLVTKLLAGREYEELVRISGGERLSADELREAVLDYGTEVVFSPRVVDDASVVAIQISGLAQWSVNVPLWTREEQPSDLTLSLTVSAADSPLGYTVEIDDLHVL